MYRVVVPVFPDAVHGGVYRMGDSYPKDGVKPTEERIKYLLSSKNKMGMPIIQKESKDK